MSNKTSLLKSRVTGRVRFSFYRDQALWYQTDDGWIFPVPVSDTDNQQGGSATFLAEDKAITFMRWIRKHIELEESYTIPLTISEACLAIIDLSEVEAEHIVTDAGFILRVVNRDGRMLMGTEELRGDRINVAVVNDVVTRIAGIN